MSILRARLVLLLVAGGWLAARPAQGACQGGAADAYLDRDAAVLHEAAMRNWRYVDDTVVRYTALVKQRLAAQLRTPLRDRTLYRSESAARVFWDRDDGTLVQVMAAREQTPAGVETPDIHDMMDDHFDPAGDRLLMGMSRSDELPEEGDDDFWFEHPLAPGAVANYRFRTGDTLTLSLPDGRRLRAVELEVLPRREDVHLLTGSLWIEPASGALVRAAYRLADRFDAFRDVAELREEEDESLRRIPGLFKPWTFELSMVYVDYGLWDFEVWLPRALRVEGIAQAGILKAPASFETSWRVESVVTEADLDREAAGEAPAGVVEERRFANREEAMAFVSGLLRDEEGVAYEPDRSFSVNDGRRTTYLAPVDRDRLATSPHLPPPIWDDAPGFPARDEVKRIEGLLADLPQAGPSRGQWAANWLLQRPDLFRYNRVEGPALGARFQYRTSNPLGDGPLSLTLTPFVSWSDWRLAELGFDDLELKARLTAEHESLRRRTALGVYHEMRSAVRRGKHLELGNTLTSLLFGRDDGEYFLATGADLVIAPPTARREAWRLRLYHERHRAVANVASFSVANAFEDDWSYRPNIVAEEHTETGAELLWRPASGTDPLAPQLSGELYGQAAAGELDYGRASLLLRAAVPFDVRSTTWKAAVEVEGGESWGAPPLQRHWFLGGPTTLRGYGASTLSGPAFARARAELGRVLPVLTLYAFSDAGWAGSGLDGFAMDDALISAGLGASFVDGLIRLDVARGLRAPKDTRWDFYLDAAF